MKHYCEAAGREVTDLEMLENPDWWPMVILPLINRADRDAEGQPRLAAITESGANREAGEESIYLLWQDQSMFEPIDLTKTQYLKANWLPHLIDAGWRVD